MFVMVKCGVLFEVRTELLNIIEISNGFKGQMFSQQHIPYEGDLVILMLLHELPKDIIEIIQLMS
jgi:hypothetical protein